MARRQKTSGSPPAAAMPIEVDPSFVRVFADQTLVMHLGRDIDIAMLAVGPRLERIQRGRADANNDVMELRPQLNEVARIRLNPNAAAIMAMEVLQGLVRSGIADKPALISALEEIEEPEQPDVPDTDAPAETAETFSDPTDEDQ